MAATPQQQAYEDALMNSVLSSIKQPTAQLGETQAAAGAAGASAALQGAELPAAQIRSQQAGALQGLRNDLHNGMTLSDAMDKYKALGMNANDIFNQYLSENTYGPNKTPKLPVESPIQLHGMGVTDAVLGNVGDTGTFADKWNTGSAIEELRLAQNYFNKTKAADIAGNIAGINANSKAYENIRNIIGLHLSSLIPGASGAQSTGQELLNMLPSSKDIRSYTPDMINSAFNAIEKGLMTSKRYNYNDIGVNPLPDSSQNQTTTPAPSPKSGGDLLSTILTNAGKDFTGMLQGQAQNEQKYGSGFGGALFSTLAGIPGAISDYGKLIQNPQQQATAHPLNTALEVLGPLLGLKSGAPEDVAGGTGGDTAAADTATTKATTDVFSKAPGKLQQIFQPGKAKNVIGQIRDQLINNADQTGTTINGDQIASGFRSWANQAKLSNPSDAAAIEDAATTFEKEYAGKTFKPSQLKTIYDNIESGYTTKGAPRSATASYIDRGVQDILQQQLEKAAPGFAKTTDLFSKTYNAEKGTTAKIVKNLPQNAIKAGLNVASLGIFRDLLGL